MKQHSMRQQPQARLTGQILTMADSNIQPQCSHARYFSLAGSFAGSLAGTLAGTLAGAPGA